MPTCGETSANIAWYRADSLALNDGDTVQTWTDDSGQGRDLVQAVVANRFIYKANAFGAFPALRAPDAARFMTIPVYTLARPGAASGGRTFYFVTNYTPQSAQMYLLSTSSAFGGMSADASEADNHVGIFQSHVSFVEGPAAVGGWQVLAYVYDWGNGRLRIYRNGTMIYNQATGGGVGNDLDSVWTIGTPGGVLGLIGDLLEVQLYSVPHDDRSVSSISTCLMCRLGITADDSVVPPAETTTNRSLFREYTNERDSDVVPDSVVDIYLQSGLEAFNRRTGYCWKTDSSSVVLVAGTQEYDLPSDLVTIQFVEWNGRELKRSDVERWRDDHIDWRNEAAQEPLQWAHYSSRLILRPKPSAEAVAAAASPVIRYNATPRAIGTYGMEMVNTQDQRIPVFWAVAEWCFHLPGAPPGVSERGKKFLEMFEAECSKVALEYQSRRIAR